MHSKSNAIIDRGVIGPMFGEHDIDDERDTTADVMSLGDLYGILALAVAVFAALVALAAAGVVTVGGPVFA